MNKSLQGLVRASKKTSSGYVWLTHKSPFAVPDSYYDDPYSVDSSCIIRDLFVTKNSKLSEANPVLCLSVAKLPLGFGTASVAKKAYRRYLQACWRVKEGSCIYTWGELIDLDQDDRHPLVPRTLKLLKADLTLFESKEDLVSWVAIRKLHDDPVFSDMVYQFLKGDG